MVSSEASVYAAQRTQHTRDPGPNPWRRNLAPMRSLALHECVAVVPVLTAGGQNLGMRDGPGGKDRTQPNVAIAPREGELLVK